MNNPKALILTVLSRHIGRGNGIGVKQLEQQLGVEPRQVRKHISELREEGHAICGTPATSCAAARCIASRSNRASEESR